MDKVILGREVYDQIMYYVNKTNFEISGLGAVEIIEGVPTVTKIYLLDQENSSAETEMDGAAIAKLMYEHHISGHPGELKFWWHSHVDMGVFWSGTDMATIEELTQHGWFIHGVFNKKDEYKLAYTTFDPFWVMMDDIPLEIDEDMVNDDMKKLFAKQGELMEQVESECDALFDKHVKIKTFTSKYWPGPGGYGGYSGDNYPNTKETKTKDPKTSEIIDVSNESNYNDDFDHEGYWELLDMGYTDDEIATFNHNQIFCAQDLKDFDSGKNIFNWYDNK